MLNDANANAYIQCPACRRPGQHVPGYFITNTKIVRCFLCKGWGIVTELTASVWRS